MKARQGSTTMYSTVVEAWDGEEAAAKGVKKKSAKEKAKTTPGTKNKKHKKSKKLPPALERPDGLGN